MPPGGGDSPAPSEAAGGGGSGSGSGPGSAGGSDPTAGGTSVGSSGAGAGEDAHGPLFSVGGFGDGRGGAAVPVVGAELVGFDTIDWAVPALTLTVPGLLLMLAVIAQLSAGAIWLPIARRWLGAVGWGRRRPRPRPD